MRLCGRRAKRRHAEAEGAAEEAGALSGYDTAAYGGYFSEGPGACFSAGVQARVHCGCDDGS